MKCELIGIKGSWLDVFNSCRTTVGKQHVLTPPSSEWKRKILLAEHSPIRQLIVKAKWTDLPYWVSVHLTRHKIGVEHWVRTQRSDRVGVDRDLLSQSALVEHEIEVNAQAIINISRKRLCNKASAETQHAWTVFLDTFKDVEPELHSASVRECIYRGKCTEIYPCTMHK